MKMSKTLPSTTAHSSRWEVIEMCKKCNYHNSAHEEILTDCSQRLGSVPSHEICMPRRAALIDNVTSSSSSLCNVEAAARQLLKQG
jgi:hypothetical protein